MQITPPLPRRRTARESVLPMINVVFLLLIFFLMTAQIEPAAPFALTPPEGEGTPGTPTPRVLWVSAAGELAFDDQRGEAALAALAADPGPALLRADAGLPAAELAALLARLGALGVTEITLSARAPGAAP
ncbi:MAG: biopolymer transporter ExbD [Pararhodobacter sp.]|nr:biopolymer transporter ExbD [Pararhodobacter sp.]